MPPLPSGLLSLLLICAQTLSRVRLFATPCQAPLSMGILQARILEWVAMPSSKGSSQPRDRTVSLMFPALVGRLFTTEPPEKPNVYTILYSSEKHLEKQYTHLNFRILHC